LKKLILQERSKSIRKTAKEVILEADMLLSAVGIKTNIENIGLEEVGIATDKDKILVNEYYNTYQGTTPSVMLHRTVIGSRRFC
jgi:pyruvate/2-oxoglutarate dehydrogenase complex dihydrolipoamide dehydrogenase (E3) component